MARVLLPMVALAAVWVAVPPPTAAAAPGLDVDAYTTCTATTVPAPDQDFDAVVTNCCVQHAGVPAPTRFGMGCVAPMDGASDDERPTIVLPRQPESPEQTDSDLNGLIDMPLPDPPP